MVSTMLNSHTLTVKKNIYFMLHRIYILIEEYKSSTEKKRVSIFI